MARSGEEIRAGMGQALSGSEQGLVGLWNFDAGDARDLSPRGHHGQLLDGARCVVGPFPGAAPVLRPALVAGRVADDLGPVGGVVVRLKQGEAERVRMTTGQDGNYRLAVFGKGTGILDAWLGEAISTPQNTVAQSREVDLEQGQTRQLDLDLKLSQTALPASRLAFWRGDGDARDAAGHQDGTLEGGATFAAGLVGQAFSFDGEGGYVELAPHIGDFGTNDFSIGLWFWCAKMQSTSMPILLKRLSDEELMDLHLDQTGRVQVEMRSPDNVARCSSTQVLSARSWHYLVLTRRGKELGLYLDGQLDTLSATQRPVELMAPAPVLLGASLQEDLYFAGLIDEVTVANRALAPAEIQSTYLTDLQTWRRTTWVGWLEKGGIGLLLLVAVFSSVRYYAQRRESRRLREQLLGLINNVLDLSKIEAGRMELQPVDFDLGQLVEGLAGLFELRCQQQGLVWRVEREGEGWLVRGDESKLRQVLINLLGNAVKFTERGEVVLRVQKAGKLSYFEVKDTGPGIAAQQQQAVFEPFQQGVSGERQGGTGLGLAIARQQVELMGGQLQLESAQDQGARFFFTVPLEPAQGPAAGKAVARRGQVVRLAAGWAPRLLIVDDVSTNREVLVQALEHLGAQVRQADSGEAALEAVRQERPDLVFMDLRMPGMGGLEALRQLRRDFGLLPVAAILASVMEHERQFYLNPGFDAFLEKPFRLEHLYTCLEQLLGVQYEYAEPPADFSGQRLPASLRERLRRAAEMHNVTEVQKCLDQLQGLGAGQRRLAAHLNELALRFDMDSLLQELEKTADG